MEDRARRSRARLAPAHDLTQSRRFAGYFKGICGRCGSATSSMRVRKRKLASPRKSRLSSWAAAHRVPYNMCGSQVMWGQLGELEHIDVAALVAPRPLLVESGTDDLIFPVAAAKATVAALRDVYDTPGAGADLEHDVFDGPHAWHGARAYDFLAEHL